MSIKAFFWGLRISAFVSLLGLVAVLFFFSPYENQNQTHWAVHHIGLFYLVLFFFLSSLLALILSKFRQEITGGVLLLAHIGVSLRQGIFLALVVIALLILQSFRILTWWDGALTIGAIMMVELYFLAR